MTRTRSSLRRRLPALFTLMLMPLPALASGLAAPAAIDREIAVFTGQPLGAPGGAARPIDRRLRLAACIAPLALSWHGDDHASVLVQCPDPGGWRLYAAIAAPARQISAAAPVVERGQVVTVAVTGDNFAVSQSAEALESGPVGAWIRVRVGPKGDPLQAQVVRPGLVELPIQ